MGRVQNSLEVSRGKWNFSIAKKLFNERSFGQNIEFSTKNRYKGYAKKIKLWQNIVILTTITRANGGNNFVLGTCEGFDYFSLIGLKFVNQRLNCTDHTLSPNYLIFAFRLWRVKTFLFPDAAAEADENQLGQI